ncbi:MAG: hypothetical protein QM763_11425 [Agriterribacter sp.]
MRSGVFHFYPKNTNDHFIIYAEPSRHKEINGNTGDTIVWDIQWTNECSFIERFMSADAALDKKTAKFLKAHSVAYKIEAITDDYFTFKGYVDKLSGVLIQQDTVWFSEKTHLPANPFIQPITSIEAERLHFADTSKYALLYVYRPGKLTNSLSNYPVYLNDDIICIIRNRSGYVFKILKEGTFECKSRLLKDESEVQVNIQFGKRYFIKSMVHWGMYKGLNNYKLEMAIMPGDTGSTEFSEVRKF